MPDYEGASIVNLMSSIAIRHEVPMAYPPLRDVDTAPLDTARHVVLIVVDGLGHSFLRDHGSDSFLWSNVWGRLTSVFPSTTSASLTSFATGLAPAQHAITGWFVHLREAGVVTKILPFCPRYGGPSLSELGISPRDIFDRQPFFDMLPIETHYVIPAMFLDSDYTLAMAGRAYRHPYESMTDFAGTIRDIVRGATSTTFSYAYWPRLDTLCHTLGPNDPGTVDHFRALDSTIEELCHELDGTDTAIVVTADHGAIDVPASHVLHLEDHPRLADTLSLPLCGEARVPYCYVRPSSVDAFTSYVEDELSDVCDLFSFDDLLEGSFYGRGEPHPRLRDRVGDYALLMRGNYVLIDSLQCEKGVALKGYHGGLSEEELFVPFVVCDLK